MSVINCLTVAGHENTSACELPRCLLFERFWFDFGGRDLCFVWNDDLREVVVSVFVFFVFEHFLCSVLQVI